MVLLGPDVSHYQSGFNFAQAAAEGMSFAIGKVSQGSGMRDTQWPKTRDQARAAGLILAGYHFLDTSSAAAQAANCASWIGDKSIPIALDWETGGGNFANLAAVLKAFRTAGLNVRLIYTGAWYWSAVGSPDMTSLGLPVWKSRYPTTTPGSPSALYAKVPASYWAGVGGLDTKLLQFTDHAQIAGMQVDCSAFNGTRDELAALLGSTPTEDDDMFTDADRAVLNENNRILRDIWQQLAGPGAEPGEFVGWEAFPGGSVNPDGTPVKATLVDFGRQADVDLTGLRAPKP